MVGVGVAQVCALLRYMVLTRLLGPEQLGLAVTLILTAQFFDSVSDSGSDRFLIQDEYGDDPRTQSLVQLLSVTRGVGIALALLVFAGPIAWFYNEPGLTVGLMWLGLTPLIAGWLHFDVRRAQRHNDFYREGVCMVAADIASVAATVAAAILTRSYIAALVGLTVRSLALVIVSHVTAERRYKLSYEAELAPRLGAFALPLMANGLVLFLSSQGDRLLVGNQLGVVELGKYSAVLLLIYFPSMALMKYFHALQMPIIVAARARRETLLNSIDRMAGDATLLSLGMAAGFALVAPVAAPLLFGPRFIQPPTIVALVGVLQVCRFIRIWPTTSALALGHSRVVLTGNLLRLIAYPTAIAGVWMIGGLLGLTLGFVIGEIVSVAITIAATNRVLKMPISLDFDRVATLAIGSMAITAASWTVETHGAVLALLACALTAMLLGAIAWREREAVLRWWALATRRRLGGAGRMRA
jgi:O-antigen/teichoic acid export membrane protein